MCFCEDGVGEIPFAIDQATIRIKRIKGIKSIRIRGIEGIKLFRGNEGDPFFVCADCNSGDLFDSGCG